MKKILLAGAAVAALASGAQAADLGAPRQPIAAVVVMPAFSWTGFYVGGQVGYGSSRVSGVGCAAPGLACTPFSNTRGGLVGGLHAGYNWQINSFVLGLEADVELNGARGSVLDGAGFYERHRTNWQASLRARAGVAVDRALFYITGGAAFTSNTYSFGVAPVTTPAFHIYSKSQIGWTLGAGIEYAFTPNWTARAEYRYANFGRTTDFAPAVNSFGSHKLDTHTVRLGVSYLFSTGPSAVVARY